MTKRELQAAMAVLRAEVRDLRRERDGLLAVLGNAALAPQLRITAIVLAYWQEGRPRPDGARAADVEELARRAGTTPAMAREQLEALAAGELIPEWCCGDRRCWGCLSAHVGPLGGDSGCTPAVSVECAHA